MNQRILNFLSLCAFTVLLLTGCQSKTQKLIPVTGIQDVSLSASESARDHVLEYVISSSYLSTLPPRAGWQQESDRQLQGEYQFHNGNWLMIVRSADAKYGHQHILLINKVAKISWSGYITSDGRIMDTSRGR